MDRENTGSVSFPTGAGQPQNPSPQPGASTPGQPEQGSGSNPQFLTLEAAERMWQEREERILQQVQSRTDKVESRIDKKIKSRLEALNQSVAAFEAAGTPLPPEQIKAARQAIYDQAYLQTEADPEPAPARPAAAQQPAAPQAETRDPIADFVNARVDKILTRYQVEITQEEAEAGGLRPGMDPNDFLDKLEELAASKAKQQKTPPAARVPSLGAGGATNLQGQFEAEKAKLRRGDALGLQKLRMKYRGMGLEV